jgi:glycosyltransferase involved in cell wall biosynthesis
MRFSIVIPAYNGESYLRLAIRSALGQKRKGDEVIVVDDASTDQTAVIAKSSEWNGSVEYFYNGNSTGFVDAWNRAIARAKGDFVTILHQDDLLHPDYLLHIEKALQLFPGVKHIYTACNYIDGQGNVIGASLKSHSLEPTLYTGKDYAKNYLDGVILNRHIHRCPGVTTSRELLLNQCTYRKEAGHIADDDFFLRVGVFTHVIGIAYPLASYREHVNSQTCSLQSLTLQLAKDYVFQTKYYKQHNTLLDTEDILRMNRITARFINLLLFHSLLYRNEDWLSKSCDLRREFEDLLKIPIRKHLPGWARLMWAISGLDKNNDLARCYVQALNCIRRFRDLIRKGLRTICCE